MRFATTFVAAVLFAASTSMAVPIMDPSTTQLEVRAITDGAAAPIDLDLERRSYYPRPHHHHHEHRHEERDLEELEARSFWSKVKHGFKKALPSIKKAAGVGFKVAQLVLRDENSAEVTIPLVKREPEPEPLPEPAPEVETVEIEARSLEEPEELEARDFEEEMELEARDFDDELELEARSLFEEEEE